MTFDELRKESEDNKKLIQELKTRIETLESKLQGDGTIVLSGNRLKVDRSGSLSDYQLKT